MRRELTDDEKPQIDRESALVPATEAQGEGASGEQGKPEQACEDRLKERRSPVGKAKGTSITMKWCGDGSGRDDNSMSVAAYWIVEVHCPGETPYQIGGTHRSLDHARFFQRACVDVKFKDRKVYKKGTKSAVYRIETVKTEEK